MLWISHYSLVVFVRGFQIAKDNFVLVAVAIVAVPSRHPAALLAGIVPSVGWSNLKTRVRFVEAKLSANAYDFLGSGPKGPISSRTQG